MVGWHHQLDGHEFEQAPGAGDGQGGLACCSPWGHKESDTTERLNNSINPSISSPMLCLIGIFPGLPEVSSFGATFYIFLYFQHKFFP